MEQLIEQTPQQAEHAAAESAPKRITKRPYFSAAIMVMTVFLAAAAAGAILVNAWRFVKERNGDDTVDLNEQEQISPFIPNPYKPEDFRYEGDYLTCVAGESVLGIDISSFQGQIRWDEVRAAGVQFVMIRVGGRGYGQEGILYADELAQENYNGAKAAGLQVGAYFFSQAISEQEAKQEALYALDIVKDWQLDMPIVYDWEYINEQARTANVDARTMTDCALAFCRTVEAAGKEAMLYFNPNQSENHTYLEEMLDYRLWLAMYTDEMTYPYRVDMWQYTCEGKIPGIDGAVDINLYFP